MDKNIFTGWPRKACGISEYQILEPGDIKKFGLVDAGWNFGSSPIYRSGEFRFMLDSLESSASNMPKDERRYRVRLIYSMDKR